MITVKNDLFRLDTENTSYVFRVMSDKHLQQLYYGARVGEINDASFLCDKQGSGQGTSVARGKDGEKYFPDNTRFECSTVQRGDFRESMIVAADEDDGIICDFTYTGYELLNNFSVPDLPCADGKEQTLAVHMQDESKKLKLTLYYSTLTDCDVIIKSAAVTNYGDKTMRLTRIMSSQLDLPQDDYLLDTLDGAWARERQLNTSELHCGVTKIDSKRGVSSNCHNPYVVLRKKDSNRRYGEAYGLNLMYSGNHAEIFDKTPLGKIRALNGVNDYGFCWHLHTNETFYSPEATLCFSDKGTNELSRRYHKFVNEHVVPKNFRYKQRPILVNNWEATYFNFSERKLLDIAKKAANLGAELFVLDDGWFGKRTDDTKGLGDWTVNKKRLSNGLDGLAKKINGMGLKFGVWVEPEMVNPDSDLYRAHPDWAVKHPGYEALQCRNQLLLDLTNRDVCDYLVNAMSNVFESAHIEYVKWDFNRPLTEAYSAKLGGRQGEFYHRFILGYYYILDALINKFPDILFEECASGGNRFDLGVLRYMPQIWCSDNTDSFDRVKIHEGTLYGYPASCIGSHVSASPNHQTLRKSSIDNRFNTACIGAFGYELDLSTLSKQDCDAIKMQIAWYKKYRQTLQFGEYHLLKSVFNDGKASWAMVAPDKSQAVVNLTNTVHQTIPPQEIVKVTGLDAQTTYKFQTRRQNINLKDFGGLINQVSPVRLNEEGKLVDIISRLVPLKGETETYILTGEQLEKCGVALNQEWSSTGYDGNTRVMFDFGSRLYSVDKAD